MARGLLGFAVAGAAAGVGEGMVQAGTAKRAEALKMLELEFRAKEGDKDREFRAGEATKDRGFRATEAEADRAFRAGESAAAREHQATESDRTRAHARGLINNAKDFTDKDGKVWLVGPDGVAKPVLGPDGKQIVRSPERGAVEDLVEVGDPQSPTGTRWVPKSQAAGQPGKTGSKEGAEAERAETERRRSVARRQAEAEARSKAGWFSTDTTDFAETGGSREAWIERRTDEIMAGKVAPEKPKAEKPAPSKPPADASPAPTRDEAALARARDAIARGADRAKVEERLRQAGIDPSKL